MTIGRRHFLRLAGIAGAAGPGAVASAFARPPRTRAGRIEHASDADSPGGIPAQTFHPDAWTGAPGTACWFIGNGRIAAALQTAADPSRGTQCGLFVFSPGHFCRKASTFLFHPERGAMNTRVFLTIENADHAPESATTSVRRDVVDGVPALVVEWKAGTCDVREELWTPADTPALVRTVTVTNRSPLSAAVRATALLYPNPMLFDEYEVDRGSKTLTARGYATLTLFSDDASDAGDRHLRFDLGTLAGGMSATVTMVLALDMSRREYARIAPDARRERTRQSWARTARIDTGDDTLNRLFRAATDGLAASVSSNGKMDGGIWQYNLEWPRDMSMAASALTMLGMHDRAAAVLDRILARFVTDRGGLMDASRERPDAAIELDQNGALLHALRTHWRWSGDARIIDAHWDTIARAADFVLSPPFLDPATGMVRNAREYWERDGAFGVRDGFENAYQFWTILGLTCAAEMARHFGSAEQSSRWSAAADCMRASYLSHPTHSLVEHGGFVKRRLSDGSVQSTLEPPDRNRFPDGMPLRTESRSLLDPDASCALPIAYGMIPARGPLASTTLASLETLWNQRWDGGGYGRYHVSSEPDSPGAWPFATMFLARAYCEAGDDEKVWRALRWIGSVPGAEAGSWLEFYGSRPVPPLPPVGYVVWTWAELAVFFLHHLCGMRPEDETVVIRPRLLSGMDAFEARLPIQGAVITLRVSRGGGAASCRINGKEAALRDGALHLQKPLRDQRIDFTTQETAP